MIDELALHKDMERGVQALAVLENAAIMDALAMQESELHAQESVREACREAFERYKDWNKVRTALGVGTRD